MIGWVSVARWAATRFYTGGLQGLEGRGSRVETELMGQGSNPADKEVTSPGFEIV